MGVHVRLPHSCGSFRHVRECSIVQLQFSDSVTKSLVIVTIGRVKTGKYLRERGGGLGVVVETWVDEWVLGLGVGVIR